MFPQVRMLVLLARAVVRTEHCLPCAGWTTVQPLVRVVSQKPAARERNKVLTTKPLARTVARVERGVLDQEMFIAFGHWSFSI